MQQQDDVLAAWIKEQQEKTAKKRSKPQRASKTDVGSKVYAEVNKGNKIPAIVLETAFSHEGNYLQCRLKVAQYNSMSKQWLVSQFPKPVQSYKLTKRNEVISELDDADIED